MPVELPGRIVLTGFMGSGKSTVGRLLAKRLGRRFVDLDKAVEAREGLSVPQLFGLRGEAAFRLAESAALEGLLRETNLVLALGGGAIEAEVNRELLRAASGTAVVFLEAPFTALRERCRVQAQDPDATARPLFENAGAVEARFKARHPLYREVATLILDTLSLPPEALAEHLEKRLKIDGGGLNGGAAQQMCGGAHPTAIAR